ncbi:hypothetical protein E9531_17345, partial [Lampropedia puyangensis]
MVNWDYSSPSITNAIFWNNQDTSSNGTAQASVANDNDSTPAFRYSLIQGCNPDGTWNTACGTDGTDNLPDEDPLFVAMPDPADAPSTGGDLRLRPNSPAIDTGNNAALHASITTDLAGRPRIQNGRIDLGAFEVNWLSVAVTAVAHGRITAPTSSPVG